MSSCAWRTRISIARARVAARIKPIFSGISATFGHGGNAKVGVPTTKITRFDDSAYVEEYLRRCKNKPEQLA